MSEQKYPAMNSAELDRFMEMLDRKRDAADEMYALLERYYNSNDGERDAYEYQDELEACDDAWIKIRARINGEATR